MIERRPVHDQELQGGRSASTLVRNPNWDPKTDYRPAYLDKITFEGGNDTDVAGRRILSGKGLISGDYAAPAGQLKRWRCQTQQGPARDRRRRASATSR